MIFSEKCQVIIAYHILYHRFYDACSAELQVLILLTYLIIIIIIMIIPLYTILLIMTH